MSQQEMIGASKALNKTITDILHHLGDDGEDRPGPYENKRKYLYDKLSALMITRYKQGFKKGHQEAYREFESTESFPLSIEYKTKKVMIDGSKKPFTCKSKIV